MAIHAPVNRSTATLEVVTSGGQTVASSVGGSVDQVIPSDANSYYFIRVSDGGVPIAYSSPIWIQAG